MARPLICLSAAERQSSIFCQERNRQLPLTTRREEVTQLVPVVELLTLTANCSAVIFQFACRNGRVRQATRSRLFLGHFGLYHWRPALALLLAALFGRRQFDLWPASLALELLASRRPPFAALGAGAGCPLGWQLMFGQVEEEESRVS